MRKLHPTILTLVVVIAWAIPTVVGTAMIAPSTVHAAALSTVFSDDFSGDVPGQPPAGWIARGDSQITPTVQEIGGVGPQYRELSFPDGSGYLDKWELVDNLTLSAPYTVTVKQRFLVDVADRAGITIGWKDATLDRIDIQPNVYFDDIEFRASSAIGSNFTVSGPATANGGLPIAGNTDYWMRVSASLTSSGDGQVVVSWSTDGTNFAPVLTAVGPSLAGNALTGLVGVGTAGPHLPPTLFDDFQVVSAIPVPTALTVTAVNPTGGSLAGGTPITITGTGFVAGASVTIGGTAATNVIVNGAGTSITATPPAHAAGAVTVIVTNPDGKSATLSNGYTYVLREAKKVVVLLAGIGSDLTTAEIDAMKGSCADVANDPAFGYIKLALYQKDFVCDDFLRYSYTGGFVDKGVNHEWHPAPYQCQDTGQSLGTSVQQLRSMLVSYRQEQAKAGKDVQFVLVGHSLGGVLALETTNFLGTAHLPAGSIAAVVTIDSPLNHVSRDNSQDLGKVVPFIGHTDFACKAKVLLDSPVARELGNISSDAQRQQIRRQQAALVTSGQGKGVRFMTIGNDADCAWYLTLCNFPRNPGLDPMRPPLPGQWIDDRATMLIDTANVKKRYPLGTQGCDLSGGANLLSLKCLSDPHGIALKDNGVTGDIASFIGRKGAANP